MSDDSFFKNPTVQEIFRQQGVYDNEQSTTDMLKDLLIGSLFDVGTGFINALPGAKQQAINGVKENMEKAVGKDNRAWLERESDRTQFKPFKEQGGYTEDMKGISDIGRTTINNELIDDFKKYRFTKQKYGVDYDVVNFNKPEFKNIKAARDNYIVQNRDRKEKYYLDLAQDKFVTSKHFSDIENQTIARFADQLKAAENAPGDIIELIQQTIEKNHGPEIASAAVLEAKVATSEPVVEQQKINKKADNIVSGLVLNNQELFDEYNVSTGGASRAVVDIKKANQVNDDLIRIVEKGSNKIKLDMPMTGYYQPDAQGFFNLPEGLDANAVPTKAQNPFDLNSLQQIENFTFQNGKYVPAGKDGGRQFLNTVSNLVALTGDIGEQTDSNAALNSAKALNKAGYLQILDNKKMRFYIPNKAVSYANISREDALKLEGPELMVRSLNGLKQKKNATLPTLDDFYGKYRFDKIVELNSKSVSEGLSDEEIIQYENFNNQTPEDNIINTLKFIIKPETQYLGTEVRNPAGGEPLIAGKLTQEEAQIFLDNTEKKLDTKLPDIQELVNELLTQEEMFKPPAPKTEIEDEGGLLDSISSFFRQEPEVKIQNQIDKLQENIQIYQEGSSTRDSLEKQLEDLLAQQKSLLSKDD